MYSEKATKLCKIFPLLLTVCTVVKSKRKISQNFVAFSEYMNFTNDHFQNVTAFGLAVQAIIHARNKKEIVTLTQIASMI